MKIEKKKIEKKPRTDLDGKNSIIEKRWCWVCQGFHHIEKTNKDDEGKKTTEYRCTNCNKNIWKEIEEDNESFPSVFFDDFKKSVEVETNGEGIREKIQ